MSRFKNFSTLITSLAMLFVFACVTADTAFSQRAARQLRGRVNAAVPAKSGAITPYDLQVEYLTEPQGIDSPNPRFTWKLQSAENGQLQKAAVLKLYKVVPALKYPLFWQAGNEDNFTEQSITYNGDKPLEPGTQYFAELTVWGKSKDGTVSKQSAQTHTYFSTGLFSTGDEQPWKGKWIGVDSKPNKTDIKLDGAKWIAASKPVRGDFDIVVGKSVFRKTFDFTDDLAKAELAIAADNFHKTYVNGVSVKGGTNFRVAEPVNITKHIKKGKNVVVVEVENADDSNKNPNPSGIVGVIQVTAKTPTLSLNIVTDASWKSAEGLPDNFAAPSLDDSKWNDARVQCDIGQGPWGKITTADGHPALPARYLRKMFTAENPNDIVRATAYISGLGYYELFINGEKVGDHVCDPVLTNYEKRVPYVTYNIPPMEVMIGKTTIGVALGNGRYYAPRKSEPTNTLGYGDPKLLFQLEIQYRDGTTKTVVSDESWEITTDGPIRENNDYDGEIYDSRLELRGWKKAWANAPNEGEWQAASVVAPPKGKLVAQMMPPRRIVEEFKPISVTEVRPGVWVYDFGVNLVGHCRLTLPLTQSATPSSSLVSTARRANNRRGSGNTVTIQPGTEILLRHAETLVPDGDDKGTLYVANLRGAKCRDIYTVTGKAASESYEPVFTYHGFRYAEITGLPEGYVPTKSMLTAFATNTDLPKVSTFKTSNETINAIYRNIVRGTQGNYLSIPTDCPQRDERQGWQGDRAGEAMGEMYLFDNVTLYKKWLIDIEDTQREDGNLSDVAPPYWPLYGSNVTWPSAFTIIPETIFTMYGDRRPIETHYEAMKRWLLNHLGGFVKDGLISKDNYGDWCVPPESKELIHSGDPARKTDKTLLATSYYIHNLRLLEKFAKMLGKNDEAQSHSKRADDMTAAFNAKFYKPDTGRYDNGTQTSCVLPLYFGIVPKGDEQKVFNTLIANIENVTKMHIGTGLIGGQWLNCVLTDYGRSDIAYTFTTNRDYPSWGYMIEKGATTIWELWNGDTANPAMNSGNHVMLVGDLGIWYFETLAGIKADPEKPGFANIIMKPLPQKDLKFVNATYDSPRGEIASSWEVDAKAKKFTWNIKIPCGSTATVTVPTTDADSIKCNSEVKQLSPGVYEVQSGSYRFTSALSME
ncbi:MAG: glycoside hydrolase family 78 protein [Planctomycetaceae bacterium]|jgi:alpha-L-rhamnosidase|nr:glycoside hydrolase family 78 protein [Planctomycetaceae bacterium]